jgi:anti-sigma factor RsiW
MKCSDVERSLSAFVDGRLEPARREQVEAHIRSCEACRLEEGLLRGAATALRAAGAVEPRPGLAERFARVAMQSGPAGAGARSTPFWQRLLSFGIPTAATATAAAALLLWVSVDTGAGAADPLTGSMSSAVSASELGLDPDDVAASALAEEGK